MAKGKLPAKVKKYSYLEVSYPWVLDTSTTDAKINKVVGKRTDGSGMGLGFRDLSFPGFTEKQAAAMIKKLKKLKIKGLKAKRMVTIVWAGHN